MPGKTKRTNTVRRFEHPRNIVLVRHGETPANRPGMRQGRYFVSASAIAKLRGRADHELPLTSKGRAQTLEIGRLMREKWPFRRFDVCYDSGYRRAMETLDLILESYPKNQSDPSTRRSHLDLRERDAGYSWTVPLKRARRLFPWWGKYEKRVGPIYSRPPGGESVADAWQRVHMFLNSVRRSRPGQSLLVVTHGRIMLGFKYWMEKIPAKDINRLYDEYEHIANAEAWWYRRDRHDRFYELVGKLLP